ncbi:transposase [Treponema pectinovorum]|uniref:transposase n=1 Tax=Treponema pectinovorum TaxID=164 RepID=UPI0011CB30D2|nr:transposase [Treponema pectinovorum]
MSKYTEELKLKIVKEHKEQHIGSKLLQKKYGINHSQIRQWIAQYELTGRFTKQSRHFSGEFKLKVLNYQQEHNLFRFCDSIVFEITNMESICAWRKNILPLVHKLCFISKGDPRECQRKV